MRILQSPHQKQSGFTLVEILVIAPILIISIVIGISFLFNQYGLLTQEGAQLQLNSEAQLITFTMQDDVFFATGFASELYPSLEDAYEPGGGWTYNTTPETLIIAVPAMTANNRNPDREPVYINTVGCDADVIEENAPLYNNVVYYTDGTNLYKRTVTVPDDVDTCGESYEKRTCPPDQTTNVCSSDILVSDKLDSFEVTYYDYDNTEVTNPEQAQRITVDITLKDRAFAEDIFASNSITLRKLN
jgi:type II secretory pathway pseudopilin PulG